MFTHALECPSFGNIICKDSYLEDNEKPKINDVTSCYGLENWAYAVAIVQTCIVVFGKSRYNHMGRK